MKSKYNFQGTPRKDSFLTIMADGQPHSFVEILTTLHIEKRSLVALIREYIKKGYIKYYKKVRTFRGDDILYKIDVKGQEYIDSKTNA